MSSPKRVKFSSHLTKNFSRIGPDCTHKLLGYLSFKQLLKMHRISSDFRTNCHQALLKRRHFNMVKGDLTQQQGLLSLTKRCPRVNNLALNCMVIQAQGVYEVLFGAYRTLERLELHNFTYGASKPVFPEPWRIRQEREANSCDNELGFPCWCCRSDPIHRAKFHTEHPRIFAKVSHLYIENSRKIFDLTKVRKGYVKRLECVNATVQNLDTFLYNHLDLERLRLYHSLFDEIYPPYTLQNLTHLEVSSRQVNNFTISSFCDIAPNLRVAKFHGRNITSEVLSHIETLPLVELDISNTGITHFPVSKPMKTLRKLSLDNLRFDNEALYELKDAVPNLLVLCIRNGHFSHSGLEYLASLQDLMYLDITGHSVLYFADITRKFESLKTFLACSNFFRCDEWKMELSRVCEEIMPVLEAAHWW